MGNISTKDRLLKSALTLFVSQGVAETTTKDIAREGGVTEGAIYRHFPSKDALIQELFNHHYRAFTDDLKLLTESSAGTLDARVAQIVTFMCQLFDKNPMLYRFLLLVQHNTLPLATGANPAKLMRSFIEAAIAKGELPAQDAALSASMVLGTILQPALGLIHGSRVGTMMEAQPVISQAVSAILRASTPFKTKR